MMSTDNRPLTTQLERLRQRATLSDLARRSGYVRSASWFQKLFSHPDPWSVNPPDRDAIIGLATLLDTTTDRVNAMVAREWYRIETACLPDGVARLAIRLAQLDEEDLAQIEHCTSSVSAAGRGGCSAAPQLRRHSTAG